MENITKELDGKRFYYSFLAGAQSIFEHYKGIDRINVFPVADGDTGTNLASTMRSIIDTSIPTDNIRVTAAALADAALVGARGNSGIIFAQFLYGFSNEIKGDQNLTVQTFAEVIRNSVKYAYEAISNPVEGTMISVIREWAENIYTLKDKIDDFNLLIQKSYHKAKESLLDTPKKLEILAKANVVDAGAKGFVVFLEGMIEFFRDGHIKQLVSARNVVKMPGFQEVIHREDDLSFRYCTEALITFDKPESDIRNKLRGRVEEMGDSLVIAGSPKKIRLHIHTNQPAELFKQVNDLGTTVFKKVDDMVMQNQIVHHRKWDTAIITDSTCDLPQELLEKYQIHVVPLTVHFDREYYLDRLTIRPEEFYNMMETSTVHPFTSQPTYKEFMNKYQFLAAHYGKILGLHISDKLSGTCSNSRKAAYAISERYERDIAVYSSARVASALGLQVLRAAMEIETGAGFEALKTKVESWIPKTHLFVATQTLKYLIRGGRVSRMKGFVGKLMGVKPLLYLNREGKVDPLSRPRTEKTGMRIILEEVRKLLEDQEIWGYAITHANNEPAAERYAGEMKKLTGKDPLFIQPASPVLGAHAGPGVVGLAIMME